MHPLRDLGQVINDNAMSKLNRENEDKIMDLDWQEYRTRVAE